MERFKEINSLRRKIIKLDRTIGQREAIVQNLEQSVSPSSDRITIFRVTHARERVTSSLPRLQAKRNTLEGRIESIANQGIMAYISGGKISNTVLFSSETSVLTPVIERLVTSPNPEPIVESKPAAKPQFETIAQSGPKTFDINLTNLGSSPAAEKKPARSRTKKETKAAKPKEITVKLRNGKEITLKKTLGTLGFRKLNERPKTIAQLTLELKGSDTPENRKNITSHVVPDIKKIAQENGYEVSNTGTRREGKYSLRKSRPERKTQPKTEFKTIRKVNEMRSYMPVDSQAEKPIEQTAFEESQSTAEITNYEAAVMAVVLTDPIIKALFAEKGIPILDDKVANEIQGTSVSRSVPTSHEMAVIRQNIITKLIDVSDNERFDKVFDNSEDCVKLMLTYFVDLDEKRKETFDVLANHLNKDPDIESILDKWRVKDVNITHVDRGLSIARVAKARSDRTTIVRVPAERLNQIIVKKQQEARIAEEEQPIILLPNNYELALNSKHLFDLINEINNGTGDPKVLATIFYPEVDPKTSLNRIYASMAYVRKALENSGCSLRNIGPRGKGFYEITSDDLSIEPAKMKEQTATLPTSDIKTIIELPYIPSPDEIRSSAETKIVEVITALLTKSQKINFSTLQRELKTDERIKSLHGKQMYRPYQVEELKKLFESGLRKLREESAASGLRQEWDENDEQIWNEAIKLIYRMTESNDFEEYIRIVKRQIDISQRTFGEIPEWIIRD